MLNVLATLLALSHLAFAGPSITGGGKGVVCRENGKAKSVELLDLWEAEHIYNRQIVRTEAPVTEQVNAAIQRMVDFQVGGFDDPYFQKIVSETRLEMIQLGADEFQEMKPSGLTFHHLRGATLALSEDSFESAWPSDCAVEQIVLYKRAEGAMYINDDLYDLMPKTDQAALVLHESYYSLDQLDLMVKANETPSSVHARRLVGYVFAGGKFDQLPDPSIPHITCTVPSGDADPDVVSFTKDPASKGTVAWVIDKLGAETVVGYFKGQFKSYSWAGDAFDTLISDKECDGQPENQFFYVAGVGAGGPVDFDRYATIAGKCSAGKFTPYWTLTHDLNGPESDFKVLACTKHNL